jgi:hypothetical protein
LPARKISGTATGQGSDDQPGTVHALSAATRRLDKPEFAHFTKTVLWRIGISDSFSVTENNFFLAQSIKCMYNNPIFL